MTRLYLGLFSKNNLSRLSKNLSFDDIIKHPELPWYRRKMSDNPTMTIDHWKQIVAWEAEPDKSPFAATDEWYYTFLVNNFSSNGRQEVLPLPEGTQLERGFLEPNSTAQMDWFEQVYTNYLYGPWSVNLAYNHSYSTKDVEELYTRKLLTAKTCCKLMSSCHDVTLDAMVRIKGGESGWDSDDLLRRLPIEQIPQLVRMQRRDMRKRNFLSIITRPDLTRERLDLELETNKINLDRFHHTATKNRSIRRLLMEDVIKTVGFDHLLLWPNVNIMAWDRDSASLNKTLSITWLMEVFDKWPRVYGNFNIECLTFHATIVEFMVYLRHRVKRRDRNGWKMQRVLSRHNRRDLMLAAHHLRRRWIDFVPTVKDLTMVRGIALEDFYFFHPESRPKIIPDLLSQLCFCDIHIVTA
jgi:hypothetical protein